MELIVKTFDELSGGEVYEIIKARTEIFVVEQQIIYQDCDDLDYDSLHCFYLDDGKVTAYLRAFYLDEEKNIIKIGRVLTMKHGEGLGRRLLEESLPVLKEKMNCDRFHIDAQTHAIGFYERFGFRVTSDEFLEEGIMHVMMDLN